uniref:Protein kinase domain-containing protein n=1 Tax=Psilocybe cubensis TaxID=181762 RepID=A0A8H7XW54_PSICU
MVPNVRPTTILALGAFTFVVTTSALSLFSIKQSKKKAVKWPRREKLPRDLETWKFLVIEDYMDAWNELRPLLAQHNLELWRTTIGQQLWEHDLPPHGDNFLYLTSHDTPSKSLVNWCRFSVLTVCLHHAARMDGIRDVVLRVVSLSAGDTGQTHLRILKRLASPPDQLLSSNHILPILQEIYFEDIVIIAVPKLIYNVREVLRYRKSNSVEDALYMATAYIHQKFIAHRDLYLPNFMVEWMPESLSKRTTVARPRVYMIDFETAVDFLPDSIEADRVCTTFHRDLDQFGRYIAPELRTKEPYCPFKLDMWQLGEDLRINLVTGLDEVDGLWQALCMPNPQDRMNADTALKTLDDYLRKTPSIDLHREILNPLDANEPIFLYN